LGVFGEGVQCVLGESQFTDFGGEAFGRVCKVTEEILNDVNIEVVIAGNPSIDDLLAPDTDEMSLLHIVMKSLYINKTQQLRKWSPLTLPSSLMSKVRHRLSSPSPSMVCCHRLNNLKKVERGQNMTNPICSWHLCHASFKEKSKTFLSDQFRGIQTESEDDGSGGGGGVQLSERFEYLALMKAGREEE